MSLPCMREYEMSRVTHFAAENGTPKFVLAKTFYFFFSPLRRDSATLPFWEGGRFFFRGEIWTSQKLFIFFQSPTKVLKNFSLASLATQLNDLCKRFIESIEQLTSVEAEVEIDLIAFLLPLTICDFILLMHTI